MPKLKLQYYQLRAAAKDYHTIAAGIRSAAPELLDDPLILAAVLQVELAETALGAILDRLMSDADE